MFVISYSFPCKEITESMADDLQHLAYTYSQPQNLHVNY